MIPPVLRFAVFVALLLAVSACAPTAAPVVLPETAESETPTFIVLQMNDVYEITPVEGGNAGGLARVAGLRNRLLSEGAPVLTVLAGDYLSPSAMGTARVDGERLAGKQMVAVLNALGLDVAALGNHEFDLSEEALRARLTEADFAHVSANALAASGPAFPNVVPRMMWPAVAAPGDTTWVGITSVVLPSTEKPYVRYLDALPTLADEVAALDAEADVVIGLTHLAFADDATAAATIPGLDMVLGGHEHENVRAYRGPRLTPVLKADANARTVFVHRVHLDGGRVRVESDLVPITAATPEDPEVAAVVAEWVAIALEGFRLQGFEPERVAVTTTEALDGREGTVRTRPARLGGLIAEGFRRMAGTEAALFNGGSVRIDDVIPAGAFTEYDAIRVLPFGGGVVSVRLPGAVLQRVLEQGLANAGTGGFLQTSGIGRRADGTWTVGDAALDAEALYTIATNDFLVSGRETGLDFFDAEANPEVEMVAEHGDVRRALLDELDRVYGR